MTASLVPAIRLDHVTLAFDKTIRVPAGGVVRTGYVEMDKIRVLCRAPIAIGDIERKYELAKQNAPGSMFPPPMGEWDADVFVLHDGRHTKIAYEMLGYTHLFVMWVATEE